MYGKLKAKCLKASMAYFKDKELDEKDFAGRVGREVEGLRKVEK